MYLHLYSCICVCSSSFSQCLYLVLTIVLSGPAPGGKHKSPGSYRARIFKQQFLRSRISRSGSSSRDSSVPRVLLTQILSKSSHGTCSLGMPKKIPRVMNPLCFFWNFRSVPFRLAFGMWSGIRSDSSVSAPALFMTHQQQLSYCLFVVDQGALIRTITAKIPTKARHSQCPLLRSAASPDSDLVLCHKNIPRVNPGMIFVLPHKVGS